MPKSMTGFARLEHAEPWGTVSCELRSVNHRYLEPQFRLPENLRSLEGELRNLLRRVLSRGKVDVGLQLKLEAAANSELHINRELAAQVKALAVDLAQDMNNSSGINPIDILRWPGVVTENSLDSEVVQKAALELFEAGLAQLIEAREREGRELSQCINQRLDDIEVCVGNLRSRMPELLDLQQSKLREKLAQLSIDIDENRLAQELVILAQKSDVAEELDRLETHVAEVRRTLKQEGPIGRRLDFLMQELNREANTLSSKSIASDTTQSAVDLKVLIEQMREQIQNLE